MKLEGVRVPEFNVTDGWVTMDTGPEEGDLVVRVPRQAPPLSRGELHTQLHLYGEGFEAMIDLDADDAAALLDALDDAVPGDDNAE